MSRTRAVAVLLTALCVSMVTAAPPAHADPGDALSPLAKANPSISKEVIARFPKHLQENGKIYIDPSIKVDTPLLYLDGTPVEGQSAKMTAVALSCNKSLMIYGAQLDYSPVVYSPCGFIGTTPKAKKTYNFYRNPVYDGTACFKVIGFQDLIPTPAYDPVLIWISAGCNGGGNTSVTVAWGSVASTPGTKGKIGTPGIPWAGEFS